MSGLAKASVVVAGAGVVGSVIAATLVEAGARVVLVDPAPIGDNASGVAAGMLAPAFEAVLDPAMAGRFELLWAARDLWPGFSLRLGGAESGLRRNGALWIDRPGDPDGEAETLRTRLSGFGASAEMLSSNRVRAMAPPINADVRGAVFTPDDWRLDPMPALAALHANVAARAEIVRASLIGFDRGVATLSDGRRIAADHLMLATGAKVNALAPELAHLAPIKGHILSYEKAEGVDAAPTIRLSGGYVTPLIDGLVVGATMEAGLRDLAVDPAAVAALAAVGAGAYPWLAATRPTARTGVRAATPDGLPLVGPSSRAGVYLAVGMRRNGWLLAPLVAGVIAAYLAGDDPGPYAALLDAQRFGPGY